MATQQSLQNRLVEILGTKYVYYQPPESISLKYPCIIYTLNNIETDRADDKIYKMMTGYLITVIGRDPNMVSDIAKNVLTGFQYADFDRRYIIDNLYHDVIMVYY